jgi:hypothetical protein
MKTFCLLLVLSAGAVFAGSGMVVQERSSVTTVAYFPRAPHIPQLIMQGIKDLAVRRNPSHPDDQMAEITDGLNGWLTLQRIPNTPEKEIAAELYPFDFAKQLYLAQRPFQN